MILAIAIGLLLSQVGQVPVEKAITSQVVSAASGIGTVYEVDKANGVEIFGSRKKTSVFPDGSRRTSSSSLIRGFSRRPMNVLAGPRAITKEQTLALLGQDPAKIGKDDYYSKPVYFPSDEGLVPAIYCQVHSLLGGDEYVIGGIRENKVLYSNSLKHACFPVTPTYSYYNDDSPFPGTPGPQEPYGWQQDQQAQRVELIDGPTAASPGGYMKYPPFLSGNNCWIETALVGGEFTVWGDELMDFRYPIDFSNPPKENIPATVTNTFVRFNLSHDFQFEHGFDEAAGNFQEENYSGQGLGGDRLAVRIFFGAAGNNAFFSGNGIDGSPAKVELHEFQSKYGTPNRSSGLDAHVFDHEAHHGTSHRCVGELGSKQAKAMGEGWSDFFALLHNAKSDDDPCLTHAKSGWVMHGFAECFDDNYYFGSRRFPYTTDETKNPLTLNDMGTETIDYDPEVPKSCLGFGEYGAHPIGEIWCVVLWECYDAMYHRYGYEQGRDMMADLLVEGMKLCPLTPTFIEARDGIIEADQWISGGENRVVLWDRFAKRGYGVDAWTSPSGSTEGPVEDKTEPDWGDFDRNGVKDLFDFHAFVNAFNASSYQADMNNNNTLDTFDFLEWINLFNK